MMKLRLAAPQYVIDIDPLAGVLGYVRAHNGEIRIGAMTRHRDLLESPLLNELLAIFTDAERVIADPVVRNRGTIGGALCQADPSEDLSAVCAAVDARLVIRGATGERVIGMDEFHRGPYETAVGPAEMLVEIRVPVPPRAGSAYEKVDRRVGDGGRRRGRRARAGSRREDRQCTRRAGRRRRRDRFAGETQRPRAVARDVRRRGGGGGRRVRPGHRPARLEGYKRHVAGVLTERALARAAARAREHEEEG